MKSGLTEPEEDRITILRNIGNYWSVITA